MDLQNLSTFCTVISEGSMTAAASKLSITQPAVSQQIRQLEKEFGVKLLHRSPRKVVTTVQGQMLYNSSNQILNLVQETKTAIEAISLGLSGIKLRASTLNSIGLYLVSPVIGNFLKLHNEMKLSLSYGAFESIIRKMQHDEVDVVILPDLKKEYGREFPQYKKVHLFNDPILLVCSGRDVNSPKIVRIEELTKRRIMLMKNHYPTFHNSLIKKTKEKNITIEPSLESDNVGTLKRAVESGLGWGFLPAHSVRKQIKLGRLSVIKVEDFDYSVDVNLYYTGEEEKEKIIDILKIAIQKQAQLVF